MGFVMIVHVLERVDDICGFTGEMGDFVGGEKIAKQWKEEIVSINKKVM